MKKNMIEEIDVSKKILPMRINKKILKNVFETADSLDIPVISVVIGTKPDFYKQAPLVVEAKKEKLPVFVIDTGQHFDDVLGFGIKEFKLQESIGCDLQIRGDLMEKASELIIKFGSFGRYCKKQFNSLSQLPIVHGDTLVAGIAPLAWVFGIGQKVAQNEAGLRSMSPKIMRNLKITQTPSQNVVEKFINSQLYDEWFIARDEPFPEQIDTWICSAGTQYFFAPTELNKQNLVREGYPEEYIHVVGNSVVDAIHFKRKQKILTSIFEIYPQLEHGTWIRMDIHRRENLTEHRFNSIISGLTKLIKNTEHKVVLVMLNATLSAMKFYGLESKLNELADDYPNKFLMTPLWKEYGQVIEFLDSGHCWAEMTDSGSMQEELLYFDKVVSMTVRLNTDRPETIFDAKSNILIPPVNSDWIPSIVEQVYRNHERFGLRVKNKEQIYGKPGQVSKLIAKTIKKEFENGNANFYPWLHQRINLWREKKDLQYL
ncbi:MAG: UDP-N-acetyl glucosamine 2-epimerase [Nitrososphaeraceae archaeon]|nr:UDP-N-acetyl glucosamine 2-epimerase [Nitrososphaeraceae archaeon]